MAGSHLVVNCCVQIVRSMAADLPDLSMRDVGRTVQGEEGRFGRWNGGHRTVRREYVSVKTTQS